MYHIYIGSGLVFHGEALTDCVRGKYRDRLQTYRLTPENRVKEKEIVRQILANHKYDPLPIILEHKRKKQNYNTQTQKRKWARFTYVGKEIRFITKLFKDTNVTVAFTMNNTIGKRLSMEHKTQCKYDKSGVYQCKYDTSGVYQLTCPDCKMTYTGQTGRPFRIRFQEHMRDFKYSNRRSKFAQHLLEKGHAIGKTEYIMNIIHVTRKGRMLNTLESFHIHMETENQISNKLKTNGNEIFEAILQHDP